MDLTKTIRLIAKIGDFTHELGDYAAPIVKGLAEMRAKAPSCATAGSTSGSL